MSSPVLRTKRSRRLLFGGHHSPIQGPCGLTVALRRTGLTNLLYEVALPQQTYPACCLSTPVPQGNWSLPHEKHSNSYHLLLCVQSVSLDVAPHEWRNPLTYICSAFAIVADFRRRYRLADERQIKHSRPFGQRD